MDPLAQRLEDLIVAQKVLLAAEKDPARRDRIRDLIEELNEQLEDVVDRAWDQTASGYKETLTLVDKAAKVADNAKKHLATVDSALSIADDVVSALSGLLGLA